MELIVTEKDNAARRIADILSDGSASATRENDVNVYEWGGKRCVGLSGHVVGVDFPPEYNDWRDVEPHELIDAGVEKTPTKQNIVATLRLLARRADVVTIATDYDREGELIGKEAYEIVRDVNDDVPIERVRFSSITEREVTDAFAEPDDIDFDLAAAGEARQIIDLVWGAALTRFLSLSARQLGDDFISVGRVQSPTLRLIVDREREIEAFDPEDYWELFADLATADDESFEAQYYYLDEDGNEAERVLDEDDAEAVLNALQDASGATVTDVDRRTRTDDPPAPFNTTQFIRAAGSLGYSAKRAMSIAEDLYTAGYITYPRTDNTVYPEDLDPADLLEEFVTHRELGESAESLLETAADDDGLTPTEGDEETTDHPPIHPTGEIPARGTDVDDDEWEVYELVVRRFYATVAEPARWEHLKVVADAAGHSLKANGKRLVEAGYHDVYPYYSTSENYVPDVTVGEELALSDSRLEAKQTQPPRRYGQSRLIETMEEMGIGTKATRHETIEKLYDRGYVENDPPVPTALAKAVVEAAEAYADRVVSEEMTAQLEHDMDAIAAGDATLEDVTDESREMLESVFENLRDKQEEIGTHLQESLKADKTLGECPESGHALLLRNSRSGSYFVGCDGYPDCEYTLPLPDSGKPLLMDRECDDHGLREVKMLAGRGTFVHGCPLCSKERSGEGPILGACPDCGAGATTQESRGEGGDSEAQSASGRSSGQSPRKEAAQAHGGELAVKTLEAGSRLVGCTRYPDCEYSLPLPRRGDIQITDETCDEHDLPHLEIHDDEDDDDPWELGCPICNYREYQERESESGTGLEALDGIGATTAEKLAAAGIDSIDALSDADPDQIAGSVDGVSPDQVRSWQAKA